MNKELTKYLPAAEQGITAMTTIAATAEINSFNSQPASGRLSKVVENSLQNDSNSDVPHPNSDSDVSKPDSDSDSDVSKPDSGSDVSKPDSDPGSDAPKPDSDPGNVGGGSAFCLLIKDDNDILSEWIAYHYHVFQMRRLIVAVDPSSQTSPLKVLERWGSSFGNFDLNVTLWNDEDYTPDFFQKRDYSKIPNIVNPKIEFVSGKNGGVKAKAINQPIKTTKWHKNQKYNRNHQKEIQQEVHEINNHRFRQMNFVSECFRQVKLEQQEQATMNAISWTVHIDTDEFLVPNPFIALYVHNESDSSESSIKRNDLLAMLPETPSAGSLWSLFNQILKHISSSAECVMMSRHLFGSKEDSDQAATATKATSSTADNNTTTTSWNHTKFESLRWQYHTKLQTYSNLKSIVDVAQLTNNDKIFTRKRALNIHGPIHSNLTNGRLGCSKESPKNENINRFRQPISVYHYLGSLERYLHRADFRRSSTLYEIENKHANYAKGDENHHNDSKSEIKDNHERWWIGGWLDSFVETHGSKKAYTVLGEQYATQQ